MPQTAERCRQLYRDDPEYRERMKRRSREMRLKHYDKARAREKRWKEENAERQAQSVRAWHVANPERVREIKRRWDKNNPEKVRANAASQAAKRRQARGSFSLSDIVEIRVQQKNRCAYCRVRLDTVDEHIDHVEPIAKGGTNYRTNIQLLCAECNYRKCARDPVEFAQSMGLLL